MQAPQPPFSGQAHAQFCATQHAVSVVVAAQSALSSPTFWTKPFWPSAAEQEPGDVTTIVTVILSFRHCDGVPHCCVQGTAQHSYSVAGMLQIPHAFASLPGITLRGRATSHIGAGEAALRVAVQSGAL